MPSSIGCALSATILVLLCAIIDREIVSEIDAAMLVSLSTQVVMDYMLQPCASKEMRICSQCFEPIRWCFVYWLSIYKCDRLIGLLSIGVKSS